MSAVNSQTIAAIYRQVLTESLTAARTITAADTDAQQAIERAFNSAIPVMLPRELRQLDPDAVRAALTADAARLLVQLCMEMPLPRSPFVEAVAQAARRRL
jgi:hypothetical protein